ncbi:hypothetical protein GCM10020331_087390 [Ectobacillus funiculus]
MHYIEGRGGLIAQIDFSNNDQVIDRLITDESWKTANHHGFIKETVKMSNCLPWSEIYNAGRFDHDWEQLDFDASAWNNAEVIGAYGMNPWKNTYS